MVSISKEQEYRAIILEQKSTVYFGLLDLIDPGFTIREILIPWLQAGNEPDRFTGLHDKNSTSIFERDIMKADGTMVFSNPNVTKDIIRIVKKLPSGFTLVANNDFELPSIISNISNYTFWNTHRDWTIIGDIHRNPELMEVNP